MNADYSMPIYVQLKENIKQKILRGEYQVGDRLPSERAMAQFYGITRVTIRNALKALEKEGILVSHQGKGTFVQKMPEQTRKVEVGMGSSSRLSVDIRMGGMDPSRIVISLKKIRTEGRLKEIFPEHDYCYELVRLMKIDDQPYALQIACFPYRWFSDADRIDFRSDSLYDYMETKGHRPTLFQSELMIQKPAWETARYLDISPARHIFNFTYRGYDDQNNLVEYTKSYNKPELTSFKYKTSRVL